MIGVGSPFILTAAVIGSLLTVVLHFLSVRRPPVLMLPTMRFLPERPVRAVSRSARPSDLWLLLLRVSALMLAGIALSGVTWRGTGVKHGRIVVVQTTGTSSQATLRTQTGAALEGAFAGDTVSRIVVLDSASHFLNAAESQSFRADTVSVSSGKRNKAATLSAAILAATRAAGELVREQRTVDAIDLVIAAPLVREAADASLSAVRASWPGTIRFVNTQSSSGAGDSSAAVVRSVAFAGDKPGDAVQSALQSRGWIAGATNAATGRVTPQAPISLEWPASGVPAGWNAESPATIGAVIARGEALVYPFVRTAKIPESILAQGRSIAWWSDGEVAAVEIPTATSCTRHVGVNVPPASDVLQGESARALLEALSGPCGGETDITPIAANVLRTLEGTGGAAPASAFKSAVAVRTPFAAVLLLLALALLIAEWFVRDREDRVTDATVRSDESLRKVA